jgi:hypothetical protein
MHRLMMSSDNLCSEGTTLVPCMGWLSELVLIQSTAFVRVILLVWETEG